MPSLLAHAFAGAALGACFFDRGAPRRIWITGVACAVLPDADFLGRSVGVSSSGLFAHRAFSHSLVFAALVGTLASFIAFRGRDVRAMRVRMRYYAVLATLSHSVMDAFTTYGNGVALFAPFSLARIVSPWRPLGDFDPRAYDTFLGKVAAGMANEVLWGWLPWALLLGLVLTLRRLTANRQLTASYDSPDTE